MQDKWIQQQINEHQESFLKDLQSMMQIPSVKSAPLPQMPFGENCYQVLSQVIELAKGYGFETGIVDHAVGYAQLGAGDDYIGVVGHLDVVAAGDGWDFPPFDLSESADRFYGRGILDNKGPIFCCLYALKLIKDQKLSLKRPIRIIFGTDEESGSHDLPLYLAKEKPPIFGFTPDCKYPVVYGERGVVTYSLKTKLPAIDMGKFGNIEGDQARDHVPDSLSVDYCQEKLAVVGKRAPSNAPELGRNAIVLLAQRILEKEPASAVAAYFDWLIASFHEKHAGEGLGINFQDEDSGKLMVTPFELQKDADAFVLNFTVRYPVSFEEDEVTQTLQSHLPEGSQLTVTRRIPGNMFPKDAPGIRILSEVYEKTTGLDGTPVTTTGATYARFMPNIVAFGPSFPGQKGIAHNQNEYMDKQDLFLNMEIYLKAMLALANGELYENQEEY